MLKLNENLRAILAGVADGKTNEEIGKEMKLSTRTVETYRLRAMGILGLGSVADVVKWAIRTRVIKFETVGRFNHWVYAAAAAHRPLAVQAPKGKKPWQRRHLLFMIDAVATGRMSPTKACRWLGWIQAALCLGGCATLDQLKEINLAASKRLGGG